MKRIFGLAIVIALLSLPAAAQRSFIGGECINPSGNWIPIASSGGGQTFSTPQMYGVLGQFNGAWQGLQCDASGNLIVSGGLTCTGTAPNQTCTVGTLAAGSSVAAPGISGTLPHFLSGSMVGKHLFCLGNSTCWNPTAYYGQLCQSLNDPNSPLYGMDPCRSDASTMATDATGTIVTVVMTNALPSTWIPGFYVSLAPTAGGLGSVLGTCKILTIATLQFTCTPQGQNTVGANIAATAVGSSSYISDSIYNLGFNGGTSTSILASMTSQNLWSLVQPNDLLMIRGPIINDVRQGACNLACATANVATVISTATAKIPATADIALKTENSLLTTDPGSTGLVSAVATTSTGAVASTGVQSVTLAAVPDSVYATGQLIFDAGGPQETITVTTLVGNTITATFANTHLTGVPVVATLASASSIYSTFLESATLAQWNQRTNIAFWDEQQLVYGRNHATSPYMSDIAHPNATGQPREAITDTWVFSQLATKAAQPLPPMTDQGDYLGQFTSMQRNAGMSPPLANLALQASPSQPWTFYPQAVFDTSIYTPVAIGITASSIASGATFFDISWPGQLSGQIQKGDIVYYGGNVFQIPSSGTSSASGGNTRLGGLGGSNPPVAVSPGTQAVVMRGPNYGSNQVNSLSACEISFGATTLSTGGLTTTTGQNCLPAGSIIDGVVYRITITIVGSTGFTIGDGSTAARFCAAQTTYVSGTTGICIAQWTSTTAGTTGQATAAPIVITSVGTPSAGAVRLIVYYHTFTPPTS